MPNSFEHELMRWKTMSEAQLYRRLGKITDPVKLGNFIDVAKMNGKWDLARMAENRRTMLTISPSGTEKPATATKKVDYYRQYKAQIKTARRRDPLAGLIAEAVAAKVKSIVGARDTVRPTAPKKKHVQVEDRALDF